MTEPVQTFSLTIDRIDVILEGDDVWLPEVIEEMHNVGFSMKGGIYVMLSVDSQNDDELCAMGYVPVARRIKRVERDPTNGHEAGQPEFMEYTAFPRGESTAMNWGAELINALISSNRGKMPEVRLRHGMEDLDAGEKSH